VPTSGETPNALCLIFRCLAEPWIEMTCLGGSRNGTSNSAVPKRAKCRVLRVRACAGRHEDILDQARVAVFDVLDATEQFGHVKCLAVHCGHHWHQKIEPLQKASLWTNGPAEYHAQMRMRIDKTREYDSFCCIDDEVAVRHWTVGTRVNGNDIAPFDDNAPIFDDTAAPVHRKHEPVLDRNTRHWQHQRLTAAPSNLIACTHALHQNEATSGDHHVLL
jgi:hypothetical protein